MNHLLVTVLCSEKFIPAGRILCVAWSFDGSTLWSGDDKGRVRQWDVKNWACIRTVTCVKQNKHVPIVWDVAVLR